MFVMTFRVRTGTLLRLRLTPDEVLNDALLHPSSHNGIPGLFAAMPHNSANSPFFVETPFGIRIHDARIGFRLRR
jgi:hypothetical protein